MQHVENPQKKRWHTSGIGAKSGFKNVECIELCFLQFYSLFLSFPHRHYSFCKVHFPFSCLYFVYSYLILFFLYFFVVFFLSFFSTGAQRFSLLQQKIPFSPRFCPRSCKTGRPHKRPCQAAETRGRATLSRLRARALRRGRLSPVSTGSDIIFTLSRGYARPAEAWRLHHLAIDMSPVARAFDTGGRTRPRNFSLFIIHYSADFASRFARLPRQSRISGTCVPKISQLTALSTPFWSLPPSLSAKRWRFGGAGKACGILSPRSG